MAKKSRRKKGDNVALEMTPMIDVVFQLLIFFIVTLKQEDIMANLEAFRPAPDSSATVEEKEEPLQILIGKEGLAFNGALVNEEQLAKKLENIVKRNKDAMILIKSSGDAPHMYLVSALDICSRVGITKISVFSL
ncbi:MAG: biopolymer transporter ExbD [Kiritimatiellae bacterium]|nr:biopolymer transporter ExbD [Kiritimatiellia bacterium]